VGCAKSAIARNDALQLDTDLGVSDMWGLDCFTRASLEQVLDTVWPPPLTESTPRTGDIEAGGVPAELKVETNPKVETKGLLQVNGGAVCDTTVAEGSQADTQTGQLNAEAAAAPLEQEVPAPSPSTAERNSVFFRRVLLPVLCVQRAERAHDIRFALCSMVRACDELLEEQLHPESKQQRMRALRDPFIATKQLVRLAESSCPGMSIAVIAKFAKLALHIISVRSIDSFRVHPKGVGVRCLHAEGISSGRFITRYLGEMYPPWRWFEKTDAIKNAQKKLAYRPTLPDFYNIVSQSVWCEVCLLLDHTYLSINTHTHTHTHTHIHNQPIVLFVH
jgi:hypothetical protein